MGSEGVTFLETALPSPGNLPTFHWSQRVWFSCDLDSDDSISASLFTLELMLKMWSSPSLSCFSASPALPCPCPPASSSSWMSPSCPGLLLALPFVPSSLPPHRHSEMVQVVQTASPLYSKIWSFLLTTAVSPGLGQHRLLGRAPVSP